MRFAGTDLSDYEYLDAPRADEFDRWSSDRGCKPRSACSRRLAAAGRWPSRRMNLRTVDAEGSGRPDIYLPNVRQRTERFGQGG
jgi:hypothetical protein